jgi:predicted amidohydrolase YtcJ
MVVLDRDILSVSPEEIKDIAVLMTIVEGKVVYRADSGPGPLAIS